MGAIAELFGDRRPVLSDGAIGTMLQAAGLMPGASPEVWNVEHPERMRVIHTAYADAGARLLTTNTFGGTRPRLALHGLEGRVHELNEAGARLAAESAAACGALVLGSIGPTGELMEPLGTLAHDHRRRAVCRAGGRAGRRRRRHPAGRDVQRPRPRCGRRWRAAARRRRRCRWR